LTTPTLIFLWTFCKIIGTQTEIAQSYGRQEVGRAPEIGGLALALSTAIGGIMMICGLPLVPVIAKSMGADGAATGIVLSAAMWLGQDLVVRLLLPPSAVDLFFSAWLLAVITQPINALAFATDGIHWGTGDFRFLRNVMISATTFGTIAVYLLDETVSGALTWIWLITACWITIRAGFGVMRIWPGIGNSPLKQLPKVN
jgi:Na+-driven multidrug efflux pump